MPNQYKPCREFCFAFYGISGSVHFIAPLTEIEPFIRAYFDLQLKDTEIVEHLRNHYDTERYNVG
jgi:hypothetical protein